MNVLKLTNSYSSNVETVLADRILALVGYWSGYSIERAFSRGVMSVLLQAQIEALYDFAGKDVVIDFYENNFGDAILKMEIANEK